MKAFVINMDSRPDRMELFSKNVFPFEVTRVPGVIAKCGEDGCTQSHLNILSQQKEFPFVVFEDDCQLIEPWSVVEKAMSQLPPGWDGLWLGANLKGYLSRFSSNLFHLRKAYATHAIVYGSQRMVNFILKHHNTPSGRNLDIFYYNVVQPNFRCFITYPMVAVQISDYSDIVKGNTNNMEELLGNYKKRIRI